MSFKTIFQPKTLIKMNIKNLLLTVSLLLIGNLAFSQESKSYDYLIGCFTNPVTESEEIEIDKIGTVKPISLSSAELGEIGLFYYDVPKDKTSLSVSKLAQFAAKFHIDTWVNNSKIIKNDEQKIGAVYMIDLRLHMLLEDIYMQVITISEKGKIYQVISFADTDDYQSKFDALLEKVIKKNCF
jgi:hypothetical protein